MHEAGVLYKILEEAQKIAQENKGAKVCEIVLQIGELSACVPAYMQQYYPMLIENKDLLRDSKLTIERLPGIVSCIDCGQEYNLVECRGCCPRCNSFEKRVVSGKELVIKQISIV